MGVPQFLKQTLETAGRKIDLQTLQQGIYDGQQEQPRPLRMAIDISSWIYRAANQHSHMLADERNLSNQGRQELNDNNKKKITPQLIRQYSSVCAQTVLDQFTALRSIGECLFVLDGATPPRKEDTVQERRTKRQRSEAIRDDHSRTADEHIQATKRAGAGEHFYRVVEAVMDAARQHQIPFLVAPYESDGQLAYLAQRGWIDLIVTEDSDLSAYGATHLLYKLQQSSGILLRREDLAANPHQYDWLDFSPALVAVTFCATGGDYGKSLKGIGLKTSSRIVRQAFLEERHEDPLTVVFERLFATCWEAERLTTQEKVQYQASFLAALLSYRHPVVYDPVRQVCCYMQAEGDPELMSHQPYADLLEDEIARESIVGTLAPSPLAAFIAEGWISPKTLEPRRGVTLPDYVQDYLKQVVSPEESEVET